MERLAGLEAFKNRDDLSEYGDNGLLLFTLELNNDIDDIESVAANYLTDGYDDKKCDLVYLDKERNHVIVAQGYCAKDESKSSAPSNKASDLNTAVSWLFSDGEGLPEILQSAAGELHDMLKSNEVNTIELWYVHNLPESINVEEELKKVESTTKALISSNFKNAKIETIEAKEIGRNKIEEWYKATKAPILITEKFEFDTTGGYTSNGHNWTSYSTAVPAAWLQEMYQSHGTKLFSANVRDYLGSIKSDKNINHNIKNTAENSPNDFYVFNNGITAIVNDFNHAADGQSGLVEIEGIAIVNGAQTTGALGSSSSSNLNNVYVPARFVKCSDQKTILDIIRFNNSQNKIEAADFRSNDQIQTRLRKEFQAFPEILYLGGRRGGEGDKIKRNPNLIPSYTAGQAIAAFHKAPSVAYNKKSGIWKSDTLYSEYFKENISAGHILFVFGLLKSIEQKKINLKKIPENELTQSQKDQIDFFRLRGSNYLLASGIADSIEVFINKAIPNPFKIEWDEKCSIGVSISNWNSILSIVLPFANHLTTAITSGNLKNSEKVLEAVKTFKSLIESTRGSNNDEFSKFGELIKY